MVYVILASFEPQRHQLVEFGEGNFYSCHLNVFEQRGRSLGDRKSFFADAHKA